MSCLCPLTAWRSTAGRNPKTGLWPIVFDVKNGIASESLQVPCGQCLGCRLDRAKNWAIRCVHESRMHEKNCFLTLTYDDEHLKESCIKKGKVTLNKRDYVLFMKRLRKEIEKDGKKIKFFHCGEYGEKGQRPHHHACIFGYDFDDKILFKSARSVNLYRSPTLERIWQKGFATIGAVTFDTASYVAAYCTKKVTGPKALSHYKGRVPEYVTMSRNPGLGKTFLEKYTGDIYNYDRVIMNGRSCRPSRYYDSIYDIKNHDRLENLKKERLAKIDPEKNTKKALDMKREVLKLKFSQKQRIYENGHPQTLQHS